MPTSLANTYSQTLQARHGSVNENGIEYGFIGKLKGLKYQHRSDITDRAALEANFREKFEALNRVRLTDSEFARLRNGENGGPDDIKKIIDTYQFRKEEPRYSRRVEMAEIEIDLGETQQQLVDLEKAIAAAKDKHNRFLRELGLRPLP